MWSSNILGSDGYFSKSRKNLEALMQQEGLPTLWFTHSAADNHWQDLHKFNGCPEGQDWSEDTKAMHRRKFVQDNPHIVDTSFFIVSRLLSMICLALIGRGSELNIKKGVRHMVMGAVVSSPILVSVTLDKK